MYCNKTAAKHPDIHIYIVEFNKQITVQEAQVVLIHYMILYIYIHNSNKTAHSSAPPRITPIKFQFLPL